MLAMFYYTVFGKGLADLGNRFPSIEAAIYWSIEDPLLNGGNVLFFRHCVEDEGVVAGVCDEEDSEGLI